MVLLSQKKNIMKMDLRKNDLNVEEEETEIQKSAEAFETGCTHILQLPIRATMRVMSRD